MPLITMDFTSLSGATTEFLSFVESVFDFIMGNWLIAAAVAVPIVAGLIATVIALIKSR